MLLGSTSSDPWWFDDVENSGAVHELGFTEYREPVKTTYPQLVIPADCLENLGAQLTEKSRTQ